MTGTSQDQGHDLISASADVLREFAAQCFMKVGVPPEDAAIAADVLIESDLRGIESHGAPRFRQFYINGIKEGRINPTPNVHILHEAPATALVDGDGGLGMVVGYRAMSVAIQKARETGAGFVAVTNSRHFGISGYYSTMAMRHDMIGISMTNTGPLMVPTYGAEAMVGSNPISLAAPTERGTPFVLDMATSLVSAGKFEVANRKGAPVPEGWGLDPDGQPTTDPAVARSSRKFLPLGSQPEMGSYKGYGLGAMVDVLCGVLSGAGASHALHSMSGHFFGALRIDGFRPVADFREMMDDTNEALRATPTLPGYDQVLVPGDKEYAAKEERSQGGIPLYPDVVESLMELSQELSVPLEL